MPLRCIYAIHADAAYLRFVATFYDIADYFDIVARYF